MGEVKHHPKTSNNNNAAVEQEITKDFDISTFTGSDKAFKFGTILVTKKIVIFQIDYVNFNQATAIAKLQHSVSGKSGTFKDMGLSSTLVNTTDSDFIEAVDFSAGYIQCVIVKKTVTIGTFTIHALAKD